MAMEILNLKRLPFTSEINFSLISSGLLKVLIFLTNRSSQKALTAVKEIRKNS
jgi:hypothetical protein